MATAASAWATTAQFLCIAFAVIGATRATSETNSTAEQRDQTDVTDCNDPNALWSQAWDEQGSIANWNDDVIKEFQENSGTVGGALAGGGQMPLVVLTIDGEV